MARVAVVLAVGASPRGQAFAISGTPRRLISGRMVRISSVSPELEMASTASLAVIMPRSPWLASPGWTKKAGVPVLASVAAILPPMWPDLPMPSTTTRPSHASMCRQARAKLASMRAARPATASASVSMTARARRRSSGSFTDPQAAGASG